MLCKHVLQTVLGMGRGMNVAARVCQRADAVHRANNNARVLLSFQRLTFQNITNTTHMCSAAWSAFHLKHEVVVCFK